MIMKTLTINGQTFIIVDADAMKKIADSDLDMNGRFIHNVLDGVEDNDAATVGQLNAAVGDIETALDSIIAIQDSLIGGGVA